MRRILAAIVAFLAVFATAIPAQAYGDNLTTGQSLRCFTDSDCSAHRTMLQSGNGAVFQFSVTYRPAEGRQYVDLRMYKSLPSWQRKNCWAPLGFDSLGSPRQHSRQSNSYLIMQSDGNLVWYEGSRVVWHTNTDGNPGARLVVQNDGNAVIYSSSNRALWQTRTAGKC